MREWTLHTAVIFITAFVFQILFVFAPPEWQFQLLILTLSSNLIALGYAIFIFRKYELTAERMKPVFTSRFLKIMDASFAAMTPKRQAQVERNLEQLVALGMVYVDRIGEMSEEQFGEFIGRRIGVKLRVTPEDLRAKIKMVSGV